MAQYEVEHILDHRLLPSGQVEYLVQWKDYGLEDSTWEPKKSLKDAEELFIKYIAHFNQQSSVRACESFQHKKDLGKLKKRVARKREEELGADSGEKKKDGDCPHCESENVPPPEEVDVLGNYVRWSFTSNEKKAQDGLDKNNRGDINVRRRTMEQKFAQLQMEQLQEDCFFCGHSHNPALCRKIPYYEERREYARKYKICHMCGEDREDHGHQCKRVVFCLICGKKTHAPAFCNWNKRAIWFPN